MSIKEFYHKCKKKVDLHFHTERAIRSLKFTMQYNTMIEKALHCTENGISNEVLCDHEVIVSLTTHGKRLYDVAATIESIMQGSMKPNRIILWLGEDMNNVILPITLQNQQKRGLEVAYCKDIRSYTKLIPTLRTHPEAIIITIDDDLIYFYDLVEKLVNMHLEFPKHIIANRIHRIVLDNNNRPLSYMKWNWCATPTDASNLNFFTGVGGVLYPPQSLHPEVLNEKVFLNICKYADDIWFFAMAMKAGTKILKCYTHNGKGEDYLINEDVQDIGLLNINTGKNCANDIQLKNVFDSYNLWEHFK